MSNNGLNGIGCFMLLDGGPWGQLWLCEGVIENGDRRLTVAG
jgi:hypothetical protein